MKKAPDLLKLVKCIKENETAQVEIYYANVNGNYVVEDFIESLEENQITKILHLFRMMVLHGKITNQEKFKKLRSGSHGPEFEFKSHQVRLGCIFEESKYILLHGFIKKKDVWPPGELTQFANNVHYYKSQSAPRVKGRK